MAPKTVVIIGGSFGGLKVARGLLKDVPVAAPRILAKPKAFSKNQYLIPIKDGFTSYGENFKLIVGTATEIDETNRAITILRSDTDDRFTLEYDYLVIASGSSTASATDGALAPFKRFGSSDLSEQISNIQKSIASAKSIIIGGAGPIGIELVGELTEARRTEAIITLVSATKQLLPMLKKSSGDTAEKILKRRGVRIIKGSKVTNAVNQGFSWEVTLSDGQILNADLYISAVGVTPNNSFIPKEFLDKNGWVEVDEQFHVTGSKNKNIYAIGDITALPTRTVMKIDERFPILVDNLKADILKSASKRPTYVTSAEIEKSKAMMFVPIGAGAGTGQMMGMTPWSWVVKMIKGKDFFVPKAASLAGLA
ncbi:apoptosis-inducing factor, putative [Talaromyces stipitatus ATCC 10500]|uniref:Apoptosis-inducing factor, putative n=1 Tax=Talaromyces stipitatus (strain ATCC 10500 / CBS 375.48 / QM 6759 / NRRL 1006) TaxID=441959 RepID=B8LXD3_TALSN|nr:apoptosis-inducing factor, putative [Talaromyces stipitatus ATCC 10500]EED23214.1 apoptosis-inducing factor, putative [Talaromyces stipitatus ATCC 10500]